MNELDSNNIKLKQYSVNNFLEAEQAANDFRNYINISNMQPISDLINILENLGIIIIQIKNPNNQFNNFDGLSEFVSNVPIIVLLDDIKDGARQRFTIAHELGHLILKIDNNEIDEKTGTITLINDFKVMTATDTQLIEASKLNIENPKLSLYDLLNFILARITIVYSLQVIII